MKRKLSLAAFTLLFLVNAVATGIRTALAAAPAELLEKGRQGPFPTLPPLSITLTPPAFPVEPTRNAAFQSWGRPSSSWAIELLIGPRALAGSGIALAALAAAGIRFFRRWQFPSLAALRSCNLPKLVAGVVIAVFGIFIGLLGILLIAAGAAEGPLGPHTVAVGMFMLALGAIFVYLAAKIVIDSGCLAPRKRKS